MNEKELHQKNLTEKRKELLEAQLEAILLSTEKINEGNEGIILKLDVEDLAESERELLLGKTDVPSLSAVKLLKVFNKEIGQSEFDRQLRAYELLKDKDGFAKVPEPYFYQKISVMTEEMRQKLSEDLGVDVELGKTVEFFVMDVIEGDDLMTHLYKEVLERHPNSKIKGDSLIGRTYNQLHNEVAFCLKLSNPDLEGKGVEARKNVVAGVSEQNMAAIKAYLIPTDFSLDRSVRSKLSKSLDFLHKNGIFHRDLHNRNAMVGDDGEVYIIDFGKSWVRGVDGDNAGDDIYMSANGGEWVNDDEIINLCESLEKEIEDRGYINSVVERHASKDMLYQLGNLRETLIERGVPLSTGIIERFINISKGYTSDPKQLAYNELYLYMILAGWGEEEAQLIREVVSKRIHDVDLDPVHEAYLPTLLAQIENA